MPHPYDREISKGRWSSAFFDTVGDETGDICLCDVDGSTTPVDFKITARPDQFIYVHQFTCILRCCRPMARDGFGAGGQLANGLVLIDQSATGQGRVMTNQLPLKTNMDFAAYSPWTMFPNNMSLVWRFQITDDGTPYRLRPGGSLVWRIRDDLTADKYGCECFYIRAGMVVVPSQYR